MDKEQLESENRRLKSELYELKVEYREVVRRLRKAEDELLLRKAGMPKQIKEDNYDNIRSK